MTTKQMAVEVEPIPTKEELVQRVEQATGFSHAQACEIVDCIEDFDYPKKFDFGELEVYEASRGCDCCYDIIHLWIKGPNGTYTHF